jgi:hypothetical protein
MMYEYLLTCTVARPDTQITWLRSRTTRQPLVDFFLIFIAADGFPLRDGLAGFELTISFGNLGGVMNLRYVYGYS